MSDIVDTNVPLVVKQAAEYPRDLVDACEQVLEAIMLSSTVVTDVDDEIVEEYFHQLSRSGAPSLGDAFAKWVWENRWSWGNVVDTQPDGCGNYGPLGTDTSTFDPSDRKFIAAAAVSCAPIHQATDTKWLDWHGELAALGVVVRFVHKKTITAMYTTKFGHPPP